MEDPPPAYRTGDGIAHAGLRNELWVGPLNAAPWHTTGVKYRSPLSYLPLFDLCWDMGPDMMHIVGNLFKEHIFPMYCGKRNPSKPRERTTWTPQENRDMMEEYETEVALHESWELPTNVQKVLDIPSFCLHNCLRYMSMFTILLAFEARCLHLYNL